MYRKEKLDSVIKDFLERKPQINSRDFGLPAPHNISNLLLYQDGLNRVSTYANGLNKYVSFSLGRLASSLKLFPDIDPSWLFELPKIDELINYIEGFQVGVKFCLKRDFNRLFIYLFIYWEVYKDTEELKRFNHLPHPYESLIKVVINGDYVWMGRDHLEFSDMFGMLKGQELVLPSIEDDFLAYIDASKYNEKNMIYFLNVPNQEEVNELWETFKRS